MAYNLRPEERVSEGLKRIAREQLDDAIKSATDPGMNRDDAVHDVRKRMKKLRAVLRLARDEVGKDVYKRENAWFRGIAKQLAALRETTVRVSIMAKLKSHFAEQLETNVFDTLIANLQGHRDKAHKENLEQRNALEEVVEELHQARGRVNEWPLKREGFSSIAKGVRRVYRRGCRGLKVVVDAPTDANFHEWRKRVKYLWYHVRILEASWPPVMAALSAELDALGDVLGEDHDLAELRAVTLKKPQIADDPSEHEVLLGLVTRRQNELRQYAFPLGRRIYAEKPEAFAARLERYWNVAQSSKSG